jgi:hypothetical protein
VNPGESPPRARAGRRARRALVLSKAGARAIDDPAAAIFPRSMSRRGVGALWGALALVFAVAAAAAWMEAPVFARAPAWIVDGRGEPREGGSLAVAALLDAATARRVPPGGEGRVSWDGDAWTAASVVSVDAEASSPEAIRARLGLDPAAEIAGPSTVVILSWRPPERFPTQASAPGSALLAEVPVGSVRAIELVPLVGPPRGDRP